MEKTIIFKERRIKLKASAIILILYKNYFGVDYDTHFKEIVKMQKSDNVNLTELQTKITNVKLNMLWCMAKAADDKTEDFDNFAMQFDGVQSDELLNILLQSDGLFNFSVGRNDADETDADSGNNDTNTANSFSSENLLVCANMCGISLSDMHNMTINFLMNTIKEYSKMHGGDKSKKSTSRNNKDKDIIINAGQSHFKTF